MYTIFTKFKRHYNTNLNINYEILLTLIAKKKSTKNIRGVVQYFMSSAEEWDRE